MERGKFLAKLAAGKYDTKNSGKKNEDLKSHMKKKVETSSVPNYVQLFDKGKWDELQECLKLNINKSTNDICSKLFNNREEGERGAGGKNFGMVKEAVEGGDVKQQSIKEDAVAVCEEKQQSRPKVGGKKQQRKMEYAMHGSEGKEQNIVEQAVKGCGVKLPRIVEDKANQQNIIHDLVKSGEGTQQIVIEDAVDEGDGKQRHEVEYAVCESEEKEHNVVEFAIALLGKNQQSIEEGIKQGEGRWQGIIEDAMHRSEENEHNPEGNAVQGEKQLSIVEQTTESSLGVFNDEIVSEIVFHVSPTGELIPITDENAIFMDTERQITSKKKLFINDTKNTIEEAFQIPATSDYQSLGCQYLDSDHPDINIKVTGTYGPSGMSSNEKFEEINNTSRKRKSDLLDASSKETCEDNHNKHNKYKQQKRSWDRKNFCLYCRQLVTNFSRHIIRWHHMEKEVLEYLSIKDPNLKERKLKRQKITDDLRNRGNFLFNSSKSIEEDFLPSRRNLKNSNPLKVPTTFDYRTCRFCLCMFKKRTFSLHIQKCNKKVTDSKESTTHDPDSVVHINEAVFGSKKREYVLKRDGILILPDVEGASELLKKNILPILNREVDEVALIATNDPLILSIGSLFLYSHQEKKDYYNVTKKLRDAAKLLKACREKDSEIKSLTDCFKPSKFLTVIEAVQGLCGFEEDTGSVSVVGMPARLSYIIKEGAKLVSCSAIMNDQLTTAKKEQIKTEISEFLMLFELRWKYMVSSNAEKTRKKLNSLKPKSLPVDDDVKTMATKLKECELELHNSLSLSLSAEDYESLCKVTIAHIIILNRRRPGEVARAELNFYLNRVPNDELTSDVLETLSEEEKLTLPHLTVFMVPGKLVHSVPILLTNQMKKNIDLIISCRNPLNISHSNPLLFPRVSTQNPFDGSKIIREFREKFPLRSKENMTATGLRHHLATKSQINGSEALTENVCQFLGHSSAVHKKNYRIPLQAIQRGQIGHRLLQMESSPDTLSLVCNDNSVTYDSHVTNGASCDVTWRVPVSTSVSTHDLSEDETSCDDIDSYQQHTINRKRSVCARRRWSKEEKNVVLKHLGSYVKSKKNPGMQKCLELIRKETVVLSGRSWSQINVLINNYIKGKTKLPSNFQHLAP